MARYALAAALLSATSTFAIPLGPNSPDTSLLVEEPYFDSAAIASNLPETSFGQYESASPVVSFVASPYPTDKELTYGFIDQTEIDDEWWSDIDTVSVTASSSHSKPTAQADPSMLYILEDLFATVTPAFTLALPYHAESTSEPLSTYFNSLAAWKRDEPAVTDCPSVETRTQTTTSIEFVATSTSTDCATMSYTEYPCTDTVVSKSVATEYVYEYASPATSTGRTTTRYAVEVVPAETTVTVPTPVGFTPVLCQAAYVNPTVTSVITSETVAYEQPSTTITAQTPLTFYTVDYISTYLSTLSYDSATTFRVYPTATITTTRADPTSYVYAACATNNVTPDAPDGGYLLATISQSDSVEAIVPAIDATDCCATCQADNNCLSSAYYDSFDTYCLHYLRAEVSIAFCNFTATAAQAVGSWDERPGVWISNSECGQYIFQQTGLV